MVITSVNNTLLFLKEEEDSDIILKEDTIDIPTIKVKHSFLYQFICQKIRSHYRQEKYQETKIRQNEAGSQMVKRKVLHGLLFCLSLFQDYDFVHQGYKVIKNLSENGKDIVISSYGPLGSHLLGLKLKKKKHFKWIADFRDAIAQQENDLYEYKVNKWYERTICKNADFVTAISEGVLKTLGVKGQVITNGFDPEDLTYLREDITKTSKYRIVYTGTLYSGRRDLCPLFRVIKEIEKEDNKLVDKIEIIYAGGQEGVFFNMAEITGGEQYARSIGKVDRKKALELQKSADLLIVATWNNIEGSGILSGKFLEYLMFNKQILGIVSGKYCNSELKQRIDECNIGYCYEEADKNGNTELKKFLKNELLNYEQNRVEIRNDKKINNYSYECITKEFIDIIKDKL